MSDEKLTERQKTEIIGYLNAQESNLQSIEDQVEKDRQAAMKAQREEMKKWAHNNDIDPAYAVLLPAACCEQDG